MFLWSHGDPYEWEHREKFANWWRQSIEERCSLLLGHMNHAMLAHYVSVCLVHNEGFPGDHWLCASSLMRLFIGSCPLVIEGGDLLEMEKEEEEKSCHVCVRVFMYFVNVINM